MMARFRKGSFAYFKNMMLQTSERSREIPEDGMCQGCPYHRPDWKYRFCRYPECRQIKGMKTFREEFYKG